MDNQPVSTSPVPTPEPVTPNPNNLSSLPPQPPATQSKTNTLAIIALILACLFFIPLLPLVGLVLGVVSLMAISKNPGEKGKGLAIAAIVIGALTVLFQVYMLVSLIFISDQGNKIDKALSSDTQKEFVANSSNETFLKQIADGNTESAYSQTSQAFKTGSNYEAFRKVAGEVRVKMDKAPSSVYTGSYEGVINTPGHDASHKVSYELYLVSGNDTRGNYVALYNDGEGKIIHISLHPDINQNSSGYKAVQESIASSAKRYYALVYPNDKSSSQ